MIALLAERLSYVPVEALSEGEVPVEVVEHKSDAERWRKCIVYWCFQKDRVVGAARAREA